MKKYLMAVVCVAMIIMVCTTESETYPYELTLTETRTWPAQGISQINAVTVNGNISIAPTQDIIITAEITRRVLGEDSTDAAQHIDNIVISDSISGGQLTLEADMPDTAYERNYRADFFMTMKDDLPSTVNIVNGDITLTDMVGGAMLNIVNGDITTQNLQSDIIGNVVNGTIDCDMALLGANDSAVLSITNGDIILALPADVSATFDASTSNGNVTVTGFASVTYSINMPNHKAGTIGNGDAYIELGVVNGDITIQAR